jgi:biopolymer transport protein ExbD
MARKHRKHRRESEIPVGPFSDIAFLLIIFFILATTLVQVSGVLTDIPSGQQAEQKQDDKTPTVKLQGDRVTFNDNQVDVAQLRNLLEKMRLDKKAGDAKVVLLEASGNVKYQTYFDVMASISDAGGVTAILQEEKE